MSIGWTLSVLAVHRPFAASLLNRIVNLLKKVYQHTHFEFSRLIHIKSFRTVSLLQKTRRFRFYKDIFRYFYIHCCQTSFFPKFIFTLEFLSVFPHILIFFRRKCGFNGCSWQTLCHYKVQKLYSLATPLTRERVKKKSNMYQ